MAVLEKPNGRRRGRAGWLKLAFLVAVVCVQLWIQGSLTSYAVALHEATERHSALQGMLRDAEASMRHMQNENKAAAAADAVQRETALKQRLDLLQDDNEWLNRTVVSKEQALRTEQSMRMQLEASVHSLKEQMNLMQGQLVTAQQQQGTLHKKGGRHH